MRFPVPVRLCQRVVAFSAMVAMCSNTPAQQIRDEVAPEQRPRMFAADFTNDGAYFVTSGDAIRIYATRDGSLVQQVPAPREARALACSPIQDNLFATASFGGDIRLWHVGQSEPVRAFKSGLNHVIGLAFSPDGNILASASIPMGNLESFVGELTLWDLESGQIVHTLDVPQLGVSGVAFSNDGERLAFSTMPKDENDQSSVQVYNVPNWKLERSISYEPGIAFTLMFTNNPDQLVIAGRGSVPASFGSGHISTGTIWLANINSHEPAKLISPSTESKLTESQVCYAFRSADMTPERDMFAIGTATKRTHRSSTGRVLGWSWIAEIQMRNVNTGEVMWIQDGEVGDPYGVSVSPDGKLVGCCTDTKVLLLNSESGAIVRTIDVEK